MDKLKELTTINDSSFTTFAYEYDDLDFCIEDALIDEFGGRWLTISLVSTAINYIVDGEYKKAAAKLLDAGVKGNLICIVATLTVIYFDCLIETEGWI